ncbi:MAG: GNAT family N-acetyltransferase, partial [Bacillota bacterium]
MPEGFQLLSLSEEIDIHKVNRCLWRGFNHPGEPGGDLSGPRLRQSAPHFDQSLNIVVKAPNGDYAAYSGIWYDPKIRVAYVEPVATDPDYRRMGLGKAAVLECIRRCAERGATIANVGSGLPFYQAIGFGKAWAA